MLPWVLAVICKCDYMESECLYQCFALSIGEALHLIGAYKLGLTIPVIQKRQGEQANPMSVLSGTVSEGMRYRVYGCILIVGIDMLQNELKQ